MLIVCGYGEKKENDIPPVKWTEGRLKSFITSVLRGGFRKYPPKYETLSRAKCGKKINKASGRLAEHYKCNSCSGEFPVKDVQVDHISPVVEDKFISWDEFIKRLYCEKENLQVLCIECHKEKTKTERKKKNV